MIPKGKRPRDPNQLAKMIVDMSTGETKGEPEIKAKNPAAVALGRLGGLKGGKARAESLSAKKRKMIASNASKTRWDNARGSR